MRRAAEVGAIVALLALAPAVAAAGGEDPRIDVLVLTRAHPRAATLAGPRTLRVDAASGALRVDGQRHAGALLLPPARWSIRIENGVSRTYDGALRVESGGDELRLVASLGLEDYVARAVAGEAMPGTPDEALRAQAIVARSYALAGAPRHEEARVCDLAHCQALTAPADAREAARAAAAARATRGLVLRQGDGSIARAAFHADCGGRTGDPDAAGFAPGETGAAAVDDPGCGAVTWRVLVARAAFETAAARALGLGGRIGCERIEVDRGPGGRIAKIVDARTGRFTSGDAFARALDRSEGRGRVNSARMSWTCSGGVVEVVGRGAGHGVGLCQRGAARRAREGASAAEILGAYFARAVVVPLDGTRSGGR